MTTMERLFPMKERLAPHGMSLFLFLGCPFNKRQARNKPGPLKAIWPFIGPYSSPMLVFRRVLVAGCNLTRKGKADA